MCYHAAMRHIPLIRLGLLVIVGSVFASVVNFYIGTARQFADLSGQDLSTEPRDLLNHFADNFLFAGTAPGVLFWVGIALCIAGIARNLAGSGRKRDQ
jgi:hypothetical protein